MRRLVLIPALNEASSLAGVLHRVRAALPEAEVLVVDGGSEDATAEIAERAGALVISASGPGYGLALRAGYLHCLDQPVDQLIQLDGDGQHPPEDAPRLLRLLDHADWGVGSRAGTASPGSWSRRLGNALLAQRVRQLTGEHYADVTSGYWVLNRRALELFAQHLVGSCADANVRVLARRHGLVIRELPVRMAPREAGRSMHQGWLRSGRNFWRSLRALEAYAPGA